MKDLFTKDHTMKDHMMKDYTIMMRRFIIPIAAILFALATWLVTFSTYQAKSLLDIETMKRSNQLYENGRFPEAIQTYQQLVDQGFEDSALFYNLGNAYYKSGDFGRAILNYKRAALLAPRDSDIQANLAFVRSLTADQYERQAADPLDQWMEFVSSILTQNEISMLALGAFWLLVLIASGYLHARSNKIRQVVKAALVLSILFFAVFGFTLGGQIYREIAVQQVVLVADIVEVTNGPGAEYSTALTLHSGAELQLIEIRGEWALIILPGDQFQGWVPLSAIEIL